jgi:hypothetical protein
LILINVTTKVTTLIQINVITIVTTLITNVKKN